MSFKKTSKGKIVSKIETDENGKIKKEAAIKPKEKPDKKK